MTSDDCDCCKNCKCESQEINDKANLESWCTPTEIQTIESILEKQISEASENRKYKIMKSFFGRNYDQLLPAERGMLNTLHGYLHNSIGKYLDRKMYADMSAVVSGIFGVPLGTMLGYSEGGVGGALIALTASVLTAYGFFSLGRHYQTLSDSSREVHELAHLATDADNGA